MANKQYWYIKLNVGANTRPLDEETILYEAQTADGSLGVFTDNVLKARLYDSKKEAEDSVDCAFWQAENGDQLCWNDKLDDYDYGYAVLPYPSELIKVREMLSPGFWQEQVYGVCVGTPIDYCELQHIIGMGGWDDGGYADFAERLAEIIKEQLG